MPTIEDNIAPQEPTQQETLCEVFNRCGSPFQIDIAPVTNTSDIQNDPAFQSAVQQENAIVITDDDIEAIIDDIPNGFFLALNPFENFETAFMDELKEKYPEFHERVDMGLDRQAASMHKRIPEDFSMELDDCKEACQAQFIAGFAPGYSSIRYGSYQERVPIDHTIEGHIDTEDGYTETSYDEVNILKIPGQELDVEELLALGGEKNGGLSAVNPPPGTSEDWAALVTVHEAEHMANDHQSHIREYFAEVKAELNDQGINLHTPTKIDHAAEIEADISAAQNLKGQVPEEVLEYWAAERMFSRVDVNMQDSMIYAIYGSNHDPINKLGATAHDTGFYLDEYLQTGEIPDYLETTLTMKGFYEHTGEYLLDKTRDHFEQQGRGDEFDKLNHLTVEPPNAAEMLDIVRYAMVQDPAVYSPAEEIMAQRYIDNIGGTLGIERQSMDHYIADVDVKMQELYGPATPQATPSTDPSNPSEDNTAQISPSTMDI